MSECPCLSPSEKSKALKEVREIDIIVNKKILSGFLNKDMETIASMKEENASIQTTPTEGLLNIPIMWSGTFLMLGKISIAFVGYDIRKGPDIYNAIVGHNDNIIGWYPTQEAAKAAIINYLEHGKQRRPHV